jgi:hypothetical protein
MMMMTHATNGAPFTVKQVCPLQWLFVSILKLLKCTPVFIYATDAVQIAVYQNVTLESVCLDLTVQARGVCWPSAEYSVVLSACIPLSHHWHSQNFVNVRHTRSISCSGCHVKQQHPLLAHLHLYYHTSTWGKMDVMPYNASIQGSRNTIKVFITFERSAKMWSPI